MYKKMGFVWVIQLCYLFQGLELFVESEGFPSADYELVTNFPRRKLSDLSKELTLKQADLYPQETVFVQAK